MLSDDSRLIDVTCRIIDKQIATIILPL